MASDPNRPPQQQALNVTPLNSMPYVDRTAAISNSDDLQSDAAVETSQPSLVYLPTEPTKEELDNIFSVTKNGVVLSGSAAAGAIGPVVGKIDIHESDETYVFRVALPGVSKDEFTCDVVPDGQILIKGVTTTGEKTVFKNGMKFEMVTQNLCPPGPFSVSFTLPGPVDSQHLTASFGIDGVFEGEVKKRVTSE